MKKKTARQARLSRAQIREMMPDIDERLRLAASLLIDSILSLETMQEAKNTPKETNINS